MQDAYNALNVILGKHDWESMGDFTKLQPKTPEGDAALKVFAEARKDFTNYFDSIEADKGSSKVVVSNWAKDEIDKKLSKD